MSNDPVTIGERYSSATDSSNLRVTSERRGDADMLIAAGWLGEQLGASLFRLMHEFDAVKGEHGIASAEFERAERAACALDTEAARLVGPTKPLLQVEAAEIRQMASAQALTARAMILINLGTLREVRDQLGAYALDIAGKRHQFLELGPGTVLKAAGQALDLLLDANCHHCQGRGKNGGYGSPEVLCRACGGSGKRSPTKLGGRDESPELVNTLLDHMRRLLGSAGAGIRRFVSEKFGS